MAVKLSSNTDKKNGTNKGYMGKPITETLTNGFFTVDDKWTVKYWNKSAEKILGVRAADIIGQNLWEEFAGIIPLEFYAIDQKIFRQDLPVHFEEYWGQMGAWFNVVTYHTDNNLSVSFKSSRQIPLENFETPAEKLNVLLELYRFVSEITNHCLWELDLQTEEMFWIDSGHKTIFGYQVENALIPQSFWENCIHPDDRVKVLTKLSSIITEGTETIWQDSYRFKKADGTYACVHDKGHIVYDENKKAVRILGATRNIIEKALVENVKVSS